MLYSIYHEMKPGIFFILVTLLDWNCSKEFPGNLEIYYLLVYLQTSIQFSPENFSTGIYLDRSINLTFNHELDASTITFQSADGNCTGSIQLSRDDFITCAGINITTADNRIFTIKPLHTFYEESIYTVRITQEVKIRHNGMPIEAYRSGGFTTESLPHKSGLQIWFRANSITSFANGDTINSPWPDSSSNSWNAVPNNTPVYRTSVIEGKPAVTFDADYFKLPSASLGMLKSVTGATGIVVFNSQRDSALNQNTIDISNGLSWAEGSRFQVDYDIFRNDVLLVSGYTIHAAINEERRPRRVPKEMAALLNKSAFFHTDTGVFPGSHL